MLAVVFLCLLQLSSLGVSNGIETSDLELSVILLHEEDCTQTTNTSETRILEQAAVRVAVSDVNECFSIPSSLSLTYTAVAQQAGEHARNKLDVLLEALQPSIYNSSLQTVGVIYPGCSPSLDLLAKVLSSRSYQIPLLSFAFPYSPTRSVVDTYNTRMAPDEGFFPPATVAVVTQFGWQRVAILTEDTPTFTQIHEELVEELEEVEVSVHHQLILDSTPELLPQSLFGEDVRVFVVNMGPSLARAVLCQALKTLRYPGYVWITHGWMEERWWESRRMDEPSSCTDRQLEIYLENSLAVSLYPHWQEEEMERGSGSGEQPACIKTGPELTRKLLPLTTPTNQQTLLPSYVYLVYDAVWTAVLAYTTAPLSDYPHTVNDIAFRGASGSVSFTNGSRTLTHLTISQYRNSENGGLLRVAVANIIVTENGSNFSFVFNEGEDPDTIWPNGVPVDGTPIEVEHFPFPALMGIVYAYSCLGVLYALVCLGFNFLFRKRKLIKLSSPNLNNIIVLGAIISYLGALTFFYPEGASTIGIIWGCNLRAWTVSLGFSACYGTLNVKMWRVYAICRNPRPSMSKTMIKDYHLMLLVLGFALVDTVILVVVMALDNSRFTVTIIPNKQDPTPHINSQGIKEVSVVSRCLSHTEQYWISLLFGYKIIIQVIGLYLAFKIRNIKIRGLNDSKEVSIILYVTSFLLLIVLVVSFVYGDYIDVDGFFYGFGLSTAVTVVLSFTFIPKMVGLYRDPEGKRIFPNPTSTDPNPETEIHYLQRRVKELEKRVELARSHENLLENGSSKPLTTGPPPPPSSSSSSASSTSSTNAPSSAATDSTHYSPNVQTPSE